MIIHYQNNYLQALPYLQYHRLIPEYSQIKCKKKPVKNKLISICRLTIIIINRKT